MWAENDPENFPIYSQPDPATIRRLMEKLQQFLQNNIAAVLQIKSPSEIIACQETLYEIFTRVEQRRVYFHIYYGGKELGERNECALICFWILKLMPFKHDKIPNSTLNIRIAYTFFMNMLYYEAAHSKIKRKVNVKSELMNNTLYAFKYRDLSKEALMAMAESLLY
jgi:hypothetical protein